jgi:hypothetical protein
MATTTDAAQGRGQAKALAALAGRLGPDERVYGYAFGRGHARWTTPMKVMAVGFAVVFAVAVALGSFLLPGGILLALFFNQMRPPRGIGVTSQGLVVTSCSIWSSRPKAVLGRYPLSVTLEGKLAKRTIQLGDDRVTFNSKNIERLENAVAASPA